jgi:hypothetical protein
MQLNLCGGIRIFWNLHPSLNLSYLSPSTVGYRLSKPHYEVALPALIKQKQVDNVTELNFRILTSLMDGIYSHMKTTQICGEKFTYQSQCKNSS